MNKKLLATAVVAALAAPMAAQADVSVYGLAGIAVNNLKIDIPGVGSDSATTLDDPRGNTRLGVRWSEDLGGGLTALGEFEFAPTDLTGAPKSFTGNPGGVTTNIKGAQIYTRQTWAGLKGSFGQIEAGTVLQPYKYAGGVKYDAFVGTLAEARGGNGGMLSSAFGQGGYFANALAYRNHMGNVSFALAYSPSDENDTNQLYPGSKGDLMANVIFKIPGGEVGVAYAKNDTAGNVTSPTTSDGQVNTKIFGKYSFGGGFTVLAQWEKSKSHFSSQEYTVEGTSLTPFLPVGVELPDIDVKFIGLRYKMGMNLFAFQYGQTDFKDTGLDKMKYMALGAHHHFSKKTDVYVAYRTTEISGVFKDTATSLGLIE